MPTLASDALVEANEETVNGRALTDWSFRRTSVKGLKRNHGNGVSQRRSLVHIQYCLAGVCFKCRNGSIKWNDIVVLVSKMRARHFPPFRQVFDGKIEPIQCHFH
jgi:hypothetical protein